MRSEVCMDTEDHRAEPFQLTNVVMSSKIQTYILKRVVPPSILKLAL